MQITFNPKAFRSALSLFRPILTSRRKRDASVFRFQVCADEPLSGYYLSIATFVASSGIYLETRMPLLGVPSHGRHLAADVNTDDVYKVLSVTRSRKAISALMFSNFDEMSGLTFVTENKSVFPVNAVVPSVSFPDVNNERLSHEGQYYLQDVYDACNAVRYAAKKGKSNMPIDAVMFSPVGANATDVVALNAQQLAVARISGAVPYAFLLPLTLAEIPQRLFGKPRLDMLMLTVAMSTPVADSFGNRDSGYRCVRLSNDKTTLYLTEAAPCNYPDYTAILPSFSSGTQVRFNVNRDAWIHIVKALNVTAKHNLSLLIAKDALYAWKSLKGVSPYEPVRYYHHMQLSDVMYSAGACVYEESVPGIGPSGFIIRCDAAHLVSTLEAQPDATVLCWLRLPRGPLCFPTVGGISGDRSHNQLSAADARLSMLACFH